MAPELRRPGLKPPAIYTTIRYRYSFSSDELISDTFAIHFPSDPVCQYPLTAFTLAKPPP